MRKEHLFLLLLLCSCKFDKNKNEEEANPQSVQQEQTIAKVETDTLTQPENKKEYVDSFKIEMDSLMHAKIKLPPIYKYEILAGNDNAVKAFSNMSESCNGKMKVLVNSNLVAKELMHTINTVSLPQSDLLILIDKTGSMGDDIASVKESLGQIIDTIKKYKGTRLALAFYGDKNADGMGWYKFRNFETNYELAQAAIDGLEVGGGGDWPESVYDAVMKSLDQDFWQSEKKRNIILIGDAPPLERPLSDYNLSDVVTKARAGGVAMNFYPIIITPTVEAAKVEKSEIETYQPIKLSTSVYPIPCKGTINVGLAECDKYYMEIYDAAGHAVVSEETYGIHWTKDLGDIPDGFYILRIINAAHKFELVKFIVQR